MTSQEKGVILRIVPPYIRVGRLMQLQDLLAGWKCEVGWEQK